MALNPTNIDPASIDRDGKTVFKTTNTTSSDANDTVLDRDWVKVAFLVPDAQLKDVDDITNRYWSSAAYKYTDTRMGGNIGINARPQFTRYADIRVKGRLSGRNNVTPTSTSGSLGMGRYYSEAIDDPAQRIWLTFGVPEFNSLTNFISKAFDPNMTAIARTGRAPSVFYDLGKLAGTAAVLVAFPAIAIPIAMGKVVGSFFLRPNSKFYNLKPTMHNYWSTVNLLANTIAVNKGIIPKVFEDNGESLGKPFKLDTDYLDGLSRLIPDMFRDGSTIDVYSIANKAQRLSNQLISEDFERLNKGTATDFTGYLKKNLGGDGRHATTISDKNSNAKLSTIMDKIASFAHYKQEGPTITTELNPRIGADGNEIKDLDFFDEFKQDLDSQFRDGSRFATFIVEHTGSVAESFGNTVAESDISSKLNSISSSSRQARFAFAEGNVGGDVIKSVLGAVSDTVVGALSGVTLGFSDIFSNLAGSGYIDIPKYWQSSTASLPKSSYTMRLISPYNNVISQMQNIYIPLSMLLAGALPLSTGKASYTSPFICQMFDRGRCQIKLGVIESLSITRGTSNLPFDTMGKALAIDVSFTITDLSSIMHMPVSTGSIFGTDMTLDEDNILSDYLAVLAGQDIYSQIYAMPKAKLTAAKKFLAAKKYTSPAYWASTTHESVTSGLLQKLTLGSFNVVEAFSRNTTTQG